MKKQIDRPDLFAGLIVAVAGVIYFSETLRISRTREVVGPETLPAIVGLGLILFGVVLAVSACMPHWKTPEEAMERTLQDRSEDLDRADSSPALEAGIPKRRSGSLRSGPGLLAINFACFVAYLFAFIPLGFLLATTLFLFGMTTLYAPKRWLRNALFAVVFSVTLYLAFKNGLGVFLPPGLLG